jgi:hypothetical protein
MVRRTAFTSLATLFAIFTIACESLLGSVEVTSPLQPEQTPGAGGRGAGPLPPLSLQPLGGSAGALPQEPLPSVDAGQAGSAEAGADAGEAVIEPDAEPPPPVLPRPVVVDGPVSTLERVGVEGGQPRLGLCEQGFVIGVRPTANPLEETFGQRVTFIEPICGSAQGDSASGAIQVVRNDSILRWESSGDFQGVPTTEVPDERLSWVPQPETTCPQTAPVLVGLSGEYDSVAPDASDSAVIRSLVIECAPLVVAPNGVDVAADAAGHQLISRADSFAASGAENYDSACDGGAVITQLQLHAGFWLDGFVLGCSSLRSPLPASAACGEARDCQSGTCLADGACAP